MSQHYSNEQDSFMNDLIGNEIFKHCSKENMNLQQCINVNRMYNSELSSRCAKVQLEFNNCVKEIKSIQKIMANCQVHLQNYQMCIFKKQKALLDTKDEDKLKNSQIVASEACFEDINRLRDCCFKQLK